MQVAASSLPEGLHYAEVQGIDSKAPWRGPIFRYSIQQLFRSLSDSSHRLHALLDSCKNPPLLQFKTLCCQAFAGSSGRECSSNGLSSRDVHPYFTSGVGQQPGHIRMLANPSGVKCVHVSLACVARAIDGKTDVRDLQRSGSNPVISPAHLVTFVLHSF